MGFSKTGFPGLAMVNVLIMAELFGAKASVGIIVPMLIVCDLTVYPMFRNTRHGGKYGVSCHPYSSDLSQDIFYWILLMNHQLEKESDL